MDPEAFMGLKVAISTLLKALQQVLANAGPEVEEFGEALSYTVQSMMLSLKGGSPEEIEALNAAADAAIRASGVAAGTDMRMLLSVTSATVGLIVASVPPAGYDRMKDALGDGYDQLPQRSEHVLCLPALWQSSL